MTDMKTCSIEGCERPRKARGWCGTHWLRWRKHGSPHVARAYARSPEESFLARTEPLPWSGCLIWTGALSDTGYGSIVVDGKTRYAHRYAYEREHGPIPDGMAVDHMYHCDRACVEVSHLRLATQSENGFNRKGATVASKTGTRGVLPHQGGFVASAQFGGREARRWFKSESEASAWIVEQRGDLSEEFAGRG